MHHDSFLAESPKGHSGYCWLFTACLIRPVYSGRTVDSSPIRSFCQALKHGEARIGETSKSPRHYLQFPLPPVGFLQDPTESPDVIPAENNVVTVIVHTGRRAVKGQFRNSSGTPPEHGRPRGLLSAFG